MSFLNELKQSTEEARHKINENHRLMRGTNVAKEIHQLTVRLNKAASLGESEYLYRTEIYSETKNHFEGEGLKITQKPSSLDMDAVRPAWVLIAETPPEVIYTLFSWD